MRYPTALSITDDYIRRVCLWLLGVPIPIIILPYLFHVV